MTLALWCILAAAILPALSGFPAKLDRDFDNARPRDPDFWRDGVRGYRVRQILLAPDGRSLVFAVERAEEDPAGANVRYMVETLKQ